MSITVTEGPAEEPISLDEAKAQVRVDDTSSDDVLTELIVAARQHVEGRIGRGLITQTRVLRLDAFPEKIQLRDGLLQSVESIAYVDENGDVQTLSADEYQVDEYSDPPRIVPAYASVWPTTRCQPNAVTVTYVCGYADAATVPGPIKAAIRLIVGDLFALKEESVVSGTYIATGQVANLLAPYVSYAT